MTDEMKAKLAKDSLKTKADNRRVLKRYSESMEALLKNGYQYRVRPSGHDISSKFQKNHGGAISPNLLGFAHAVTDLELEWGDMDGKVFESLFPNLIALSNTASNDQYLRRCKDAMIKPHPARFPIGLPAFFIEFLTEKGDLVVDPFAGSNLTGAASQMLERHWLSCDLDQEGERTDTYIRASSFRFDDARMQPGFDHDIRGEYEIKSAHTRPQKRKMVGLQEVLKFDEPVPSD